MKVAIVSFIVLMFVLSPLVYAASNTTSVKEKDIVNSILDAFENIIKDVRAFTNSPQGKFLTSIAVNTLHSFMNTLINTIKDVNVSSMR